MWHDINIQQVPVHNQSVSLRVDAARICGLDSYQRGEEEVVIFSHHPHGQDLHGRRDGIIWHIKQEATQEKTKLYRKSAPLKPEDNDPDTRHKDHVVHLL